MYSVQRGILSFRRVGYGNTEYEIVDIVWADVEDLCSISKLISLEPHMGLGIQSRCQVTLPTSLSYVAPPIQRRSGTSNKTLLLFNLTKTTGLNVVY